MSPDNKRFLPQLPNELFDGAEDENKPIVSDFILQRLNTEYLVALAWWAINRVNPLGASDEDKSPPTGDVLDNIIDDVKGSSDNN